MAGGGKMKRTGADDAGNRGGPGRPPLSEEEKMKKKEEKNKKSRESRAIKKCEFSRLLQEEKVFKAFCEEHGMTEVYQNYREKCKKRTEESSEGTEEQKREFNEEVDKLGEVILDCGTNQFSEEGLQLLLHYYSEDQAATVEENCEMLEGNLKAGPSNVDSNSGGEWQSSTTLMTGGVTNSSTGGHGGIGPISGTPFERAWELKRKREEELDEAHRGKRPATADNYTPPRSPIYGSQPSGFMADARRQTSPHSAAAHLFSTSAWAPQWEERLRKFTVEPGLGSNNGARAIMDDFVKLLLGSSLSHAIYLAQQYEKLQVKDAERQEVLAAASIDANPKFKEKKKEAEDLKKQVEELQEEVTKLQAELAKRDEIISKDVFKQNLAAVALGWNLMKNLLESSKDAGLEFLNLSLLDTINRCPPLLHQFNEGLTSIGQGHTNIDDTFRILSEPPVVVPCPFVSDQFTKTVSMGGEPSSCPPGDQNVGNMAANSPQLQTANTGTNNVKREDNIANRGNKAAEADNSGMEADATSRSWYP